ncbi:alpha/beta hydrolase [Metabacillus herbersteinensis]|uniref:Alpha/beta hydrolase n=1 Tax=Metabacillus herbersteinensis TaxID=283816 RepID=A0ABV6GLV1_9BACI
MSEAFTYTVGEQVIHAKKWVDSDRKPKAIIQFSHGMAEHIERYEEFASFLLKQDFFVYGNDHRGHGMTAKTEDERGYFADENGFTTIVYDLLSLTNIIENEHPNVPVILFGHSMGSFLARRYIQIEGNRLHGVILSGTGGDPGFIGKIGLALARNEVKKKGRRAESPLLDKLTFGNYNKSFKPNRTSFDWLSRDEEVVDRYIADEHCGGIFTAGFFQDLLEGIGNIHQKANLEKIPKDLPIYLFSGEKDPVGNQSKGVLEVYHSYKKVGIEDVEFKIYKEGRHEMLNELNKLEVYEDVVNWINRHLH